MFLERAIWPFTYNHTQKKVCSILVLALAVINVFPISLQHTLIYNHAFVNSILCSKLFLDVFKFSKKNYSFILIQFCYRYLIKKKINCMRHTLISGTLEFRNSNWCSDL